MKISIAMATCNGANHIREQLQSFAAQERLPDELIICDDCSADDTQAIVLDFARKSPFPVRLETNSVRLGVARNFDRALSLCTGELVFLSDQDDVWLPAKIATMVEAAMNDLDHHCFINDAWLTDARMRPVGATKMQRIREAGLPEDMMVMGCCAVFRSELLHLLLPVPPGQTAHDSWMVHLADLLGMTCRLPVPLQFYRRHGANVSVNDVNRLRAPSAVSRMHENLLSLIRRTMSSTGMRTEQLFHAQATERLGEREGAASIDAARVKRAREAATKRAALLGRRLEIRALPHLRRLLPVAAMFREGDYDGSYGATEALKDLVVGRDERA
jgi:glycosyltransferase involved in cell wall biosynthesis